MISIRSCLFMKATQSMHYLMSWYPAFGAFITQINVSDSFYRSSIISNTANNRLIMLAILVQLTIFLLKSIYIVCHTLLLEKTLDKFCNEVL